MSSSKRHGRISLKARIPATEFRILNSNFEIVAQSVGELEIDVSEGIYRIEAKLGPEVRSDLVAVNAGDRYEDWPYVEFASAAPVEGTSTSHEYHQAAARSASAHVEDLIEGGDSGLVLVVRALTEVGDPAMSHEVVETLDLLSANLDPIGGVDSLWKVDEGAETATWSANLPAGGYVLRYEPPYGPGGTLPISHCRPVWLSPNWQTLVFVRSTPVGLGFDAMSIHMSERGTTWEPRGAENEPGSIRNETLAVETALAGLTLGRRLLPDGQLSALLDAKFVNPMMGILGAHSMLLDPPSEVDVDLLRTVMWNLDQLVPGHPDVVALRIMTRSFIDAPDSSIGSIEFPPMLLKSFQGLLQHDATNPGTIRDGSLAELSAAGLVVQGLWTTWQHFGDVSSPKIEEETTGGSYTLTSHAEPVGRQIGQAIEELTGKLPRRIRPGRKAKKRRSTRISEGLMQPAVERIAQYVTGVADAREIPLGEVVQGLDEEKLSLATSLPRSTVDKLWPDLLDEVEGS